MHHPELLPPLIDDVLKAGARDAFLTPILGKKGRPAHLITILVDEMELNSVTGVVFRGSTTLGLRMRREQRICLEREWKTAKTPRGAVRVKIGRFEGGTTSTAPEYDDCVRVASEGGVSAKEVYEAAHAAAVRGDLDDA